MTPGFEKRIADKMEEASLHDLMPGFNEAQEWERLSARLSPAKRRLLPVWSYAAAVLVVCGLAIAGSLWTDIHHANMVAEQAKQREQMLGEDYTSPSILLAAFIKAQRFDTTKLVKSTDKLPIAVVKKQVITAKGKRTESYAGNEVIYNSTPCPIELRISQEISCPNIKPEAVSSSSTLQPDQSVQLKYTARKTIARNCSLAVKEIEIRSIATGEVILLNSRSLPATAQDVFSYITKEKKGELLAGTFNYDCDKRHRRHGLRLSNAEGNLILQ